MPKRKAIRLDDELAKELLAAFAQLVSEHVETHVQRGFLQRTGLARNRLFRLKRLPSSIDSGAGEMRFSFIELVRIANELGYSSLSEMITEIERESLERLRHKTPEIRRRHKAIGLASVFLNLTADEMDSIRQALEIVDGKPQ